MNTNPPFGRLRLLALVCMALPGCGGDDGASSNPNPAAQPGWVVQDGGLSSSLFSVTFGDSNHGWAAGSDSRRTQDGGATWTSTSLNLIGNKKVQFTDELHGWAIDAQNVVSTSDGGATWVTRKTATQNPFGSLSFISATTGWVGALNYEVFKTTDGGVTWASQPVAPISGVLRAIRAVKFVDAQIGWIAASDPISAGEAVLRSVDGGATWESVLVNPESDSTFYDVEAVSASTAWAVGHGSPGGVGEMIFATTDGGATWSSQFTGSPYGIWAVDFIDPQNGWAVGEHIFHTTNGGATWTTQASPGDYFFDVHFINLTTGWVVGSQGIILKTTTGGE